MFFYDFIYCPMQKRFLMGNLVYAIHGFYFHFVPISCGIKSVDNYFSS
jgi:hypothetical protein